MALKKKQITLQNIADTLGTVVTRLDGIDAKLDGIDVRLDGIDVRLDGIDVRLDGIDVRLDGIDVRLDGIDVRLDGHDKQFSGINGELTKINRTLDRYELEFKSIETLGKANEVRLINIENKLEGVNIEVKYIRDKVDPMTHLPQKMKKLEHEMEIVQNVIKSKNKQREY
ncbi:MAG: hypothetical protein IPM57_06740 [Oligoflexia bacterium]|nr:hypothetical protein [Oligoflexia bacterium]